MGLDLEKYILRGYSNRDFVICIFKGEIFWLTLILRNTYSFPHKFITFPTKWLSVLNYSFLAISLFKAHTAIPISFLVIAIISFVFIPDSLIYYNSFLNYLFLSFLSYSSSLEMSDLLESIWIMVESDSFSLFVDFDNI